jgi:hypothetical protein
MRVSLYEHASEKSEATVSDMIETFFASTANYRVVRWLKFGSLCREGARAGVKVVTCHCELCQETGRTMKLEVGKQSKEVLCE